jgi:plasmid stability protein
MSVTLSIKNAPEAVVQRLKARAARNHRSLQGELMAIVEAAAREEEAALLTPTVLLERARAARVSSSGRSAEIVRRMRDGRDARRRR